MRQGTLTETPQPGDGATYAAKLEKQESGNRLACAGGADRAHRAGAGASLPAPGSRYEGERIKVLAATETSPVEAAAPGTVIDDALTVACGEGTALRPLHLQRAGKAPMVADAFLRGRPIEAGTQLPCPATS